MERILFLGINGYVGQNIQNYLSKNGLDKKFTIYGTDISPNETKGCDINFIKCDLTSTTELRELLIEVRAEYIVNLVGISRCKDFNRFLTLNVNLSHNILDIIQKENIEHKKIILIGSAAEYGANKNVPLKEEDFLLPIGAYGLSKKMQTSVMEYFSQNSNLNICLARIFNLVSQSTPSTFALGHFANQINQFEEKGILNTGNLASKRDFLHIDDAISALLTIATKGISGEIYNICSNQSFKIRDLLQIMITSTPKIITVNEDTTPNPNNINDSYGNNNKLKQLGWSQKIDITETIKKMITK